MPRKRYIAAMIAMALGAAQIMQFPVSAAGTQYEWETGTIYDAGENETAVVNLAGASGGKAVSLLDAGDSVTLNVTVNTAGVHSLSIRYSQPYDENGKVQNLIVNNTQVGTVDCAYTGEGQFRNATVSVYLNKGNNSIKIEGAWGWTYFDSLTVTEGGSTSGAKLSNANATAETQSLYSYLCDTYGNHILSGQQESTWMGSEDYEFNIIQNASGKLPVIRGLDYMGDGFDGVNRRAKAWAAKGGIVTICWHCGSDFSGSHAEGLATNLDWNNALTPGTNAYNNLIAGMDKGAKALKELQDAGVPVIWRPFHEFDGGWFWWGKGGGENFKKLWRIMYDRYTNVWGLNNLIWILGYSGEIKDGWYPGDDCVDIIGSDTYVNHTGSLLDMYRKTAGVADKPVCLHENGSIPDPEKLKADGAAWLWFMTWHTSFIDSHEINTANYINQIYNSDYMLTLDEIPDVYHYASAAQPQEPDTPEQTYTAMAANPVISRNAPAYSGGGTASQGNDNAYWTAWQSYAPDYLAYDLSGVPAAQRQQVLAVWYNDSTFDRIGQYVNKSDEPVNYTIELNAAGGGAYPNDGWVTAVTVQNNGLSSRQHLINMQGYNWIRLNVSNAENGSVKLNFDVHDASKGVSDSWIFFGDSITAGSMVNSYGTSFAEFVNRIDSNYYPVQQNGGIGGIFSRDGRDSIDKWLADSPVRFVSIAYGTNDAWGNPNSAQAYYDNTKYMIDAILAAGKIPVLPTVPASTNNDVGPNTGNLNAKIQQLYSEYGDKLIHGPDFDTFFRNNPQYLGPDGVHPSADGYEQMRKLWADTMYANVYQKLGTYENTAVSGDVNGDGAANISDVVMLQKYLLTELSLTEEQAARADLNGDGKINAVDFTLLKRSLIQ